MNMGAYGADQDVNAAGETDPSMIVPGNVNTYGGINTIHMNKTTLYNSGTYREQTNFGNYYNQYPITSSEVRDKKPIAYRNEENSGYRAVVTNDSDHAMKHGAKLTIGNLTPRWDQAEWGSDGAGHKKGDKPGEALDQTLGYHTAYMTLSAGLLENAEVESVTIRSVPAYTRYTSGGSFAVGASATQITGKPNVLGHAAQAVETVYTWDQIKANWMGTRPDGERINIPASAWLGGDAYYFEVKFKSVDAHLELTENAYVDLFGYGIDSPNVNNATDPYYAESDDAYAYGDSYNVVHVGQTHGWGCWGGGNPGNGASRIDRQYLGRYAYVGNYYVVVDADSELKALYPDASWSNISPTAPLPPTPA